MGLLDILAPGSSSNGPTPQIAQPVGNKIGLPLFAPRVPADPSATPKQPSIFELIGAHMLKSYGNAALNAVTYPGNLLQSTTPVTTDEMIGPALNFASMLTLGAGTVPTEANALRAGLNSGYGLKLGTMKGPKELYHVVGSEYEAGQPLRSLYSRKKDAAYDEFSQRWPESGDLAQDHAHKIFFYDNAADAASHADSFGGKVLKIDPSKVDGLYLDTLEKSWDRPGFYATREDVHPEAIISGQVDSAERLLGKNKI